MRATHRRAIFAGLIVLAICLALLEWRIERHETSTGTASNTRAPGAARTSIESPVRRGPATRAEASTAAVPTKLLPLTAAVEGPSTPECYAARAKRADEAAKLASMSPSEVDAFIESTARTKAEADRHYGNTFPLCRGPGPHTDACLQIPPPSTAAESARRQWDWQALEWAFEAQARRVANRGDARSLLAAALLLPVHRAPVGDPYFRPGPAQRRSSGLPGVQPVDWLTRAQARGRNDALVQWGVVLYPVLNLSDEERLRLAPARVAARKQLAALEPRNAAAFLYAQMGDQLTFRDRNRAQIAHAASLDTFRVPAEELQTLVLDARAGTRVSPPVRRALRSSGLTWHPRDDLEVFCADDRKLVAAQDPPSIRQSITPLATCRDYDDPASPSMADCLRLAELSYTGGTRDERERAIKEALAILPLGAERERWTRRLRLQRWRKIQYAERLRPVKPLEFNEYQVRAIRAGNEDAYRDALLAREGIPLEPPPDWQPPIGR